MTRPAFKAADEETADEPEDIEQLRADRDGWKQIADERWTELHLRSLADRAETLGGAVGDALSGFGGYLRCRTCGYSTDLGDPGKQATSQGWPKHHGYTMEWITQGQIDRCERPAREVASR